MRLFFETVLEPQRRGGLQFTPPFPPSQSRSHEHGGTSSVSGQLCSSFCPCARAARVNDAITGTQINLYDQEMIPRQLRAYSGSPMSGLHGRSHNRPFAKLGVSNFFENVNTIRQKFGFFRFFRLS